MVVVALRLLVLGLGKATMDRGGFGYWQQVAR